MVFCYLNFVILEESTVGNAKYHLQQPPGGSLRKGADIWSPPSFLGVASMFPELTHDELPLGHVLSQSPACLSPLVGQGVTSHPGSGDTGRIRRATEMA